MKTIGLRSATRRRLRLWLAWAMAFALVLGLAPMFPAGATHTGPLVTPTFVSGNVKACNEIPRANPNWFGFKIDTGSPANWNQTYTQGGLEITVSIDSNGEFLSWSSNLGIDAVVVKGGNNSNVYRYDPPGPEPTHDNNLRSPDHPGPGQIPEVSHFVICWDAELQVTKTAETSFTRTWDWTIEETVDPTGLELAQGDTGQVAYTITVDRSYTDSDWRVDGAITVWNPAPIDALVTVTDDVSGVGAATVTPSAQQTIGANDTMQFIYGLDLPDGSNRTNTATATSATPKVGNGTGVAAVVFGDPTTEIDEEASVDDVQTIPSGFSASTSQTFSVNFTSSGSIQFTKDITNVSAGAGTYDLDNTATLTENDSGETRQSSARVTITVPENGGGPTEEEPGTEGLTPGFWKNHLGAWEGYSTSATVSSVFSRAGSSPYTTLGSATLLQGLSFKGGSTIQGAAQILLRAAIAAVLNAAHPGVQYPLTVGDIQTQVNDALDSQNRSTILSLATTLDGYNNLGGDLDTDP